MENIRFAFALGNDNLLANKNFIDADKFHIYEYFFIKKKLIFLSEISNPTKAFNNVNERFSILIDYLNKNNISMLVAKSYDKMIKVENKLFVPIIISTSSPDEVCKMITKYIKWLYDELQFEKREHMIFKIKNGIFKYKL
ncbi:MAG: hypothetical protein PF517_17995 [Salinivirgaceae bacterium]|jgi:hypothetical protein|nr:hypothetical protein [Salinivirgaceae bacterium]